MFGFRVVRFLAGVPVFFLPAAVHAQATEGSITKQLQTLRSVPDAQRPAVTTKIAMDIRTLPAGLPKVKLAYGLSGLSTEGDPGKETLEAVAETLAESLKENPLPPKMPDAPPAVPYVELAKLIRYEHVSANDADVQKADFTLKDLRGKKVQLSELKGKIVLVNFWATWCPPCRKEMPDLDAIYRHFQSQGLVILSISDEDAFKVNSYVAPIDYHPPVLIDTGGKVAKQFHVDGIPKSFVFDREGKLVAQSIDMRTQRQFLVMLGKAGLHN
jgi:peroxiredoxin